MQTMETTTAPPRIVDAHSLLHRQDPLAAKACDAADWMDGLVVVQNPTLRLAAVAYGVGLGSVARARRLVPEQRDAVRRGRRPLIMPRKAIAPTLATPMITSDPREMLASVIDQVGVDGALSLLAAYEKVAA
jgi:hypothetical protein